MLYMLLCPRSHKIREIAFTFGAVVQIYFRANKIYLGANYAVKCAAENMFCCWAEFDGHL